MRVLSKYHDYYDSAMAYGSDPNVVYARTEEIVENPKEISWWKCPTDSLYNREHSMDWGVLHFCGKVYPFAEVGKSFTLNPYSEYLWTPEAVDAWAEKVKLDKSNEYPASIYYRYFDNKRDIMDWGGKNYRFHQRAMVEMFKEAATLDTTDFLLDNGAPILVVKYKKGGRKLDIHKNPSLKNIDFFKVLDPFQTYQEIDMFMSGVMVQPTNTMVEVSDKVRLEKHGFDKWTMRKKVR